MKKNLLSGFSALFLSTFIYSTYNVFFRIIGYNIPLFFQNCIRSILISFFLLIPVLILKKWQRIIIKDIGWILARAFGGIIAFVAYYKAINFLEIGTTYFLFYSSATISSYILGKILFGEKLNKRKIASLILSLLGLIMVYSINVDTNKFIYLGFAILSGIGWSMFSIFSKKVSGRYSAYQLAFINDLIVIIPYFLTSILLKEQWIMPAFTAPWLAVFMLSVLMTATSLLVVYGFKRVEAQIGSLIMLNEILIGSILGLLIYKEVISIYSLIGGILIITAIILPKLNFYKKKKKLSFPG